jgi:type II secretion system protein I
MNHRQGFSLLEVILALAILVGAIAVLGELVRLGTRSAAAARDLSAAQLLCESKMSEVAAAEALPEPVSDASFGSDFAAADEWVYSLGIDPLADAGLHRVTVTVIQVPADGERPIEFLLVRWLRDPSYLPEESEAAEPEAAEDAP